MVCWSFVSPLNVWEQMHRKISVVIVATGWGFDITTSYSVTIFYKVVQICRQKIVTVSIHDSVIGQLVCAYDFLNYTLNTPVASSTVDRYISLTVKEIIKHGIFLLLTLKTVLKPVISSEDKLLIFIYWHLFRRGPWVFGCYAIAQLQLLSFKHGCTGCETEFGREKKVVHVHVQ